MKLPGITGLCLLVIYLGGCNTTVRKEAVGGIRAEGPYMGQASPGSKPVLFAPGFISTGMNERDIAFSPQGDELFYGIYFGQLVTIMYTHMKNGIWSEPVIAPFASGSPYYFFEPCMTADGKHLYFLSTRPRKGETEQPGWGNENIWVVDRQPDGTWSEPHDLGNEINTSDGEFYPSVTADGTLYFTRSEVKTSKTRIWRSKLMDGQYGQAELLPETVNAGGNIYNAFISNDESFLIACKIPEKDTLNPGRPNYVIFFREANDTWHSGINMGALLNEKGTNAISACVTRDGRYLFFASQRKHDPARQPGDTITLSHLLNTYTLPENGNYDIYWMDAGIIEEFRHGKSR